MNGDPWLLGLLSIIAAAATLLAALLDNTKRSTYLIGASFLGLFGAVTLWRNGHPGAAAIAGVLVLAGVLATWGALRPAPKP